MLLILEVILTVVAWRKGWRGWALLPGAFLILAGIMIGAILGAMGLTESEINKISIGLLPLELGGVGVLIWMTARGRRGVDTGLKKPVAETSTVATETV